MKSVFLLLFGAGLLGAQLDAPKTVTGEAGKPIDGLSAEEEASFAVGRKLFTKTWSAQGKAFFNSSACLNCHSEPNFGGFSSSPFNHVFFVEDKSNPSGMNTFSWLEQSNGRVVGQRLPFGDFEVRKPQSLYGLGLLEAVPESHLLSLADPSDKNKDGISGRALIVEGKVGRFGWKANVPSLLEFTKNAFKAELGLTIGKGTGSNLFTEDHVNSVTTMTRLLAPPRPKAIEEAGRAMFDKIGCAICHTPKLTTGDSDFPSLKNKVIEPYSDMLLHDVARGKPALTTSGPANRREFRTPPLWGIGRIQGPYFHDGSTKTLEEAVDRHEGEALSIRDKYRKLSASEKNSLLGFLKGL
ncbi:MAG: di-heme oxidoredictase family protein [Fimbriimonadaceae bacterium]